MAIFGIGSMWDEEMKDDFSQNNNFIIGWDYYNAPDIYEAVSLLKAGDIIYLKANRPGSRTIRVKSIGVVTKSFIHHFIENKLQSTDIADWNNFTIPIHWIVKDEFHIVIRGRVEVCWTDFNEAVANLNITPNQLDRYSEGLKECICRELRVIRRLHGHLPTHKMQEWWDRYKCPA